VFRGNSAAVCPLDVRVGDTVTQRIAAENNILEIAILSRTTMDTTGAGSPRQSSSICARHMPQTGCPSARSGAGARIPGR